MLLAVDPRTTGVPATGRRIASLSWVVAMFSKRGGLRMKMMRGLGDNSIGVVSGSLMDFELTLSHFITLGHWDLKMKIFTQN